MGRPKGSKNRSTVEREARDRVELSDKLNIYSTHNMKSPSQMFEDMNNLSLMVAAGVSPSLLITGTPGQYLQTLAHLFLRFLCHNQWQLYTSQHL